MNHDENVILVSGAAGMQGGAVARAPSEGGHRVAAMTRYSADIEGNADGLGIGPTRFAEWVPGVDR